MSAAFSFRRRRQRSLHAEGTSAWCYDEEASSYLWALRRLDWRNGLSDDEAKVVVKRQFDLPVEILPHLFLGDALCARDVAKLKNIGVTHVLNAAGKTSQGPLQLYAENGIAYESFGASDHSTYKMLPLHLDAARAFFAAANASGGKCLVHCAQGLNRSGVLSAAEYMLHNRTDVLSAVTHCRLMRGNQCVSNKGFQAQLIDLARRENLLGQKPGDPCSQATEHVPTPAQVKAWEAAQSIVAAYRCTQRRRDRRKSSPFEQRTRILSYDINSHNRSASYPSSEAHKSN